MAICFRLPAFRLPAIVISACSLMSSHYILARACHLLRGSCTGSLYRVVPHLFKPLAPARNVHLKTSDS